MDRTLPGQQRYFEAFIKAAQYLAGLTSQQDMWSETGKVLVNFFGADVGAVEERRANEETVRRRWIFSERYSGRRDLEAETGEAIDEVFESGFLSARIVFTPDPLSIACFPVTLQNQVVAVITAGHEMAEPLPRELLNVYLALAGLVGTTGERLASERELRRHRLQLEEEIAERKRAAEALRKLNEELDQRVKERTAELSAAKEDAEMANRAKSVFLATMSHELRSPLNSVLGFSRLMRDAPDATAGQREGLNIITRSGEHLLNLINNLLDTAKIESGRVELEESPVDLYQLVQEMQSLMQVRAAEKGLSFTVEQSPELPRHIMVDGRKLRQVLINLIGNAVKFTAHGGVILRAMAAKKESAGRPWVRFEVEDTGPGIRKEDKDRIFQPFVQLGEQPPMEAGTGLGLAISRQYVELMGGRIGVESERGKRSIFHFELPVKALPAEALPVAPGHRRVPGLAEGQPQRRLLIAEDEPGNRLLLRRLLDPLGFEIREAANGQEAVAIFGEWMPDLIWMDIRMPVMDGLEATRRIKAADTGTQTRIVAVTAIALEEERNEMLESGCDDFIRKPYDYAEILVALTRNLGVRFIYEEEAAPEAAAEHLSPEALARLPEGLLNTLEQALIRIDAGEIGSAIEEIRGHNAPLADALASEAGGLRYGQIFSSIEAARTKAGREEET